MVFSSQFGCAIKINRPLWIEFKSNTLQGHCPGSDIIRILRNGVGPRDIVMSGKKNYDISKFSTKTCSKFPFNLSCNCLFRKYLRAAIWQQFPIKTLLWARQFWCRMANGWDIHNVAKGYLTRNMQSGSWSAQEIEQGVKIIITHST